MTVNPSDCFAEEFANRPAPRFTFLTLGNKNPSITPEEKDGKVFYGEKEFGQFYFKNDEGLQKVEPFNAVVLFYTPSRRLAPFKGKETKALCESFDGEVPSVNIESPFCAELDSTSLQAELLDKKLPEAKVNQILSVVSSGDRLNSCCYKDERGRRWDLCPKSKKDEITGTKPCVYFEKIFIHDLDNDRQFRIDLKGLNLQNYSGYVSPWSEYKKFVWENQVPYWKVSARLSSAMGPKGYAVFNFTDLNVIEDSDINNTIETAHQEIFDWYNKMAAPPLVDTKKEKPLDGAEQVPFNDDINW